jgi:hypothetical protein
LDRQTILDQIKEYLFTMSDEELFEVLKLIEDYIASGNE